MNLPALLFAFVVGALLPLQVGVNAQLREPLGHPLMAALANFVVGTVALALLLLALRVRWPGAAQLMAPPLYLWCGGLLGALYIVSTVLLGPRLGAATLLALVVAGQMLASLVFDHYGLAGFEPHPVNPWRLLGVALLIGGVTLIVRN